MEGDGKLNGWVVGGALAVGFARRVGESRVLRLAA